MATWRSSGWLARRLPSHDNKSISLDAFNGSMPRHLSHSHSFPPTLRRPKRWLATRPDPVGTHDDPDLPSLFLDRRAMLIHAQDAPNLPAESHQHPSRTQHRSRAIKSHRSPQTNDRWLLNATLDTPRTHIDQVLETWQGWDELSVAAHIDKAQVLINGSLRNVDELKTLPLDECRRWLRVCQCPPACLEALQDHAVAVMRNCMLATVRKMTLLEMRDVLARVGWSTAHGSREECRQVLRLWIQLPAFPLFRVRSPAHVAQFRSVLPWSMDSMAAASTLRHHSHTARFFFHDEILAMPGARLAELLSQRGLAPKQSSQPDMAHQLIALQEYLLLYGFRDEDVRHFLHQCYWSSKLECSGPLTLRRRALLFLRHPNLSLFMPSTSVYKTTWTEEDDVKLAEAYTLAQRRLDQIRLIRPLCAKAADASDSDGSGQGMEPLMESHPALADLLRDDLRIDVDTILKAIPVLSMDRRSVRSYVTPRDHH